MRIILSPAKKMRRDCDSLSCRSVPVYISEAKQILAALLSMSFEELKKLWGCSEAIARENYQRLGEMEFSGALTPAVLAYEGLAYRYMAAGVFEYSEYDYIQEHLRILSGFYGILRPLDGICPYRLEMQAPLKAGGCRDLYEFWGSKLHSQLKSEDGIIINLASKEYSKCIEKYLSKGERYISCIFAEKSGDKLVQKASHAKMARGEMLRYMAEKHIETPEEIRNFDRLGWRFAEELSDDNEYVFILSTKNRKDDF